jgi:hypothetical protein
MFKSIVASRITYGIRHKRGIVRPLQGNGREFNRPIPLISHMTGNGLGQGREEKEPKRKKKEAPFDSHVCLLARSRNLRRKKAEEARRRRFSLICFNAARFDLSTYSINL